MSIDRPSASEADDRDVWRPERPIAPVAVFAVHDEGEGLAALYLRDLPTTALLRALSQLVIPATELIEVSCRWGVRSRLRSFAALDGRSELELVHCPDERLIEHSVLVDPRVALPEHGPGRLAVHRAHDGHAVVFARDAAVLRMVLRAYLEAWTAATGMLRPPRIPDHALDDLGAPLPDDAWHEARLAQHRRHCVLDVVTHGAGTEGQERWIARPGGEWRTGWSW